MPRQGNCWNTFGPIADTAQSLFGWTPDQIAMMPNWGPIAYIPTSLFWAWLMERHGLGSHRFVF